MGKAHTTVLVWLAILLACCSCAFALDPSLDVSQHAHTAWKVREGFTKGYIRAIAQTADGYLWLGTEFGLLRFDGVRAVPWQLPAGEHLSSSYIRGLLVARDGRFWIGTNNGLASWKDGKLTEYKELDGLSVDALLEDREGTVWAGAQAASLGKLCAVRSGAVRCYGEDGSFGQGVLAVYEDHHANVWAAGYTGLWRMKPGPPKLYPQPYPVESSDLVDGDNGTLLIGTRSGMKQLVDGKIRAYPLPGVGGKFDVSKLLRDRNGDLWIGTSDRGILHVHDGKTDVFSQSDGLSANTIFSMFEDREGNIWVATVDGLDEFRDFTVTTISVLQGLSHAEVESVLAARDGSVWMGTKDGLNRWKNGQITVYRTRHATPVNGSADASVTGAVHEITDSGLPDYVQSLFQDNSGRIWVFTRFGAAYFENGKFVPVRAVPGGQVYSTAEDRTGDLWLSFLQKGLLHLRQTRVVERIPWARLGHKDFASALLPDPVRGGIWLGFHDGGLAYFKDDQIRASFGGADRLGEGAVMDLRLDRNQTLWAATENGLSRLENGRVATLTSKNGLPCDTTHWVMEDDAHAFWLNTACGLVRIAQTELDAWAATFDKDPNRSVRVTVFDSSDGVRSRALPGGHSPRVTESAGGKLWFLPRDGVSVIDPHHLAFNKFPPPVYIEQIAADRKPYDASNSLRLPPLVRDLEIEYTALSFVAPEKVRFRYKLEGLDRDWQDAGNRRQAFYTNLPPGNYRFRVIASNNSGVWNDAGASLDFAIAPAYYQTNWFRALCVVVFLAILWALYRLRIRRVRREESKLRDVVETIPTIAWTALPDGWVDFSNHHWEEYTGLSLEKGAGSGWEAAVHPDDLKRHAEKWRASVASGEPFENEARYRRTDGAYRWFLVRAVPLRDGGGKILKWYGTKTDIEDRKRAEQLQADFAHVSRVTMMGELSASLAHEIKQPIAATVVNADACLQFLKREKPDLEDACEAASGILSAAKRAGNIIDRLQSLYKKSPPKRELVDINEIVQEMVPLLRSEAHSYAVSIRTDLAAGLPKLEADRVQLQQVLMNLMLNAIEAMKGKGGVLTVMSQAVEDGKLRISTSDTGMGLPTEKADQIFDAFFTTKAHGSGMGLAISRSIIESHGGRLWATANDGLGATFHFSLPIAEEQVEVPATVRD